MLFISVSNKKQSRQIEHEGGPFEFGRGPRGEVPRFVIDDGFVSRDHLHVEELPGDRLAVRNLAPATPSSCPTGPRSPRAAAATCRFPSRWSSARRPSSSARSPTPAQPRRPCWRRPGRSNSRSGLRPSRRPSRPTATCPSSPFAARSSILLPGPGRGAAAGNAHPVDGNGAGPAALGCRPDRILCPGRPRDDQHDRPGRRPGPAPRRQGLAGRRPRRQRRRGRRGPAQRRPRVQPDSPAPRCWRRSRLSTRTWP